MPPHHEGAAPRFQEGLEAIGVAAAEALDQFRLRQGADFQAFEQQVAKAPVKTTLDGSQLGGALPGEAPSQIGANHPPAIAHPVIQQEEQPVGEAIEQSEGQESKQPLEPPEQYGCKALHEGMDKESQRPGFFGRGTSRLLRGGVSGRG